MPDDALLKKLLVKPGMRLLVLKAPDAYLDRLVPAGSSIDTTPAGQYEFVQVFVHSRKDADELSGPALAALKPDGLLWMTYPKGTSKIKTDINRDTGWEALWQAGYVAIAAISIDDTWSALRFRPADKVKRTARSKSWVIIVRG